MAKNLFSGATFFRHPVALLVIVAFPVIVALPVMYGMVFYAIPLHGIACFYDVGFGARAVSRKTPIYFIKYYQILSNIIQPAREAR